MTAESTRPILVTGAHRSGTTWTGRMLALAPRVAYLHEPFNLQHRPGFCGARFPFWFTCLTDENGPRYHDDLARTLSYRYRFGRELQALRGPKDIARMGRDGLRFAVLRMGRKRPLMKDPIAIFSTPWLARTFGMAVVIMVRHPLAFTASLKQSGWSHPFSHFLRQPLLMDGLLQGFRTRIEEAAEREMEIVDQAILLWNIVHHVIMIWQREHPEWLIVRHEDLATDPQSEFARLYDRLDLPFTPRIRKRILRFSNPDNRSDARRTLDVRRDSGSILTGWRERLTGEEIERIRKGTGEISRAFYSGTGW